MRTPTPKTLTVPEGPAAAVGRRIRAAIDRATATDARTRVLHRADPYSLAILNGLQTKAPIWNGGHRVPRVIARRRNKAARRSRRINRLRAA